MSRKMGLKTGMAIEILLQSSCRREAWGNFRIFTRTQTENFGKRGLTLVSIFLVNLNPFIEGIKCNFCYLVFFKLILPWFYEIIKPGQNPSGTEMDSPRLLLLGEHKVLLVLEKPSSVYSSLAYLSFHSLPSYVSQQVIFILKMKFHTLLPPFLPFQHICCE